MRLLAVIALLAFVFSGVTAFLLNGGGMATMRVKLLGSPIVRSEDNAAIYQNLFYSAELIEKQSVLILSDEMISHLVRRFNLYNYYGVDRNDPYAREKIFRVVTDRLTVEKRVMDIISISYEDKDRRLAVDILNELVAKLEQMNRDDINEHLRLNAEIYDASRRELRAAVEHTEAAIQNKLELLSRLDQSGAGNEDHKINAQLNLFKLTSGLGKMKSDLSTADLNYHLALATIERDNRRVLHILSSAMPEPTDVFYVAFAVASVTAFFALLMAIAFIYYRDQYRWVYDILFGKSTAA